MNVKKHVEEIFPTLVNIRRSLHRYPELGFQEYHTAQLIENTLHSLGIPSTRIAQTGVCAVLGNTTGSIVAIRSDMDALPIQDRKHIDYASQNPGVMHACGHDAHVSIALGVAMILKKLPMLLGAVTFLFQPAEEGPGGALPMIEQGVLQNPEVDAVIGFHITNDLSVGKIGLTYGPMCASTDEIKLTVFGKGGHAAYPHHTVDAVAVACQLVTALQTVVSRNVDPLQPAVLTFGSIHGGTVNNVIADRVELHGTLRTLDASLRQRLPSTIRNMSKHICQAMGASCEIELTPGYPPLVTYPEATNLVKQAANAVLGEQNVLTIPPTMGGEDFAYFAQVKPATFFRIGSGNSEKGFMKPGHHPEFDFDEDALKVGVEVLVTAILTFWDKQ